MSRPALRALIFDIGRVLIRVDLQLALDGLARGIALPPAEVWSAIEKDPRWPDCYQSSRSEVF